MIITYISELDPETMGRSTDFWKRYIEVDLGSWGNPRVSKRKIIQLELDGALAVAVDAMVKDRDKLLIHLKNAQKAVY